MDNYLRHEEIDYIIFTNLQIGKYVPTYTMCFSKYQMNNIHVVG